MKRVLLMDDDIVQRTMLRHYFAGEGWETFEAADGTGGLTLARAHKPDLVICDVTIPGSSGIQVCQSIRAEHPASRTRIVILTNSNRAGERDSALTAGADAILTKPLAPADLPALLNGRTHNRTSSEPPFVKLNGEGHGSNKDTFLRFWGVRGSIPTPGPQTVQIGGNTSCVELRTDGELIVLDAGTGIRSLGLELNEEFKGGALDLTLLVTHTHWDHIQGFPFFAAAYNPKNSIRVLAYEGTKKGLEATFKSQMESPYFPITMQQMPSNIAIVELKEMEFTIGKVLVKATFTNHPGVCAAYRLFTSGGSIVYMPDNELFRRQREGDKQCVETQAYAARRDDEFREFLQDADVLIIDCQFDAIEYPRFVGWGHSCVEDSVRLAISAKVKKFFLFHHDPNHNDAKVLEMVERARELVREAGSTMEVEAAREGLALRLAARHANAGA